MQTSSSLKLASPTDLREARQDWIDKAYYKAGRGKQIPFAMVDAAIKNEQHPLAFQIGKSVKDMK